MKIIVFGGAGFLGSHVADALAMKGHKVVVFDKKKSPYISDNQSMVIGDILDMGAVNQAVKGCDVVYNFAGIADMTDAKMRPLETIRQNVMGNAILLDCARENGVKRYVFASSVYVYSRHGSFYRASKQSCELFIESYHEAYGLNYTILRYGSLYGTRANDHNWIQEILKEALTNRRIVRFGDGEEIREYIHVEDAARLSTEILSKEYENEYAIISGHQQIKVKDLLVMIKEILNNEIEVVYKDPDAEDSPYDPTLHYEITPYTFKPRKAKKVVGNHYIDLGDGVLDLLHNLQRTVKI